MRAVLQPESVTRTMREIASTALLWGFEAVELRAVGGPEDRVPHVSERLIRRICRDEDLPVAAVDPEFFSGGIADRSAWMNELAMLPEVAAFAGRIGCPRVLIGSFDDAMQSPVGILQELFRDAAAAVAGTGSELVVRTEGMDAAAHVAAALEAAGPDAPGLACETRMRLPTAESWTGAKTLVRQPAYARIILEGNLDVPDENRSGLEDAFARHLTPLVEGGYTSDVCLEFARTPSASAGLRLSTAFVRALEDCERGMPGETSRR